MLGGVDMAGFRIHGVEAELVRAIPHPAVTVIVEFGERSFDIRERGGRSHRGSLVRGLAGGASEARVEAAECVQVRLSPLVAPALLGLPLAELGGAVVGLDELWGPDAERAA
ncbi:transcriptional regulator, AraC family [Nocardia seriolae]|nr:transcriptional regulator, AraC family [Nocardia seriolae]